jgi:hypothetical protein
MNRGGQLERLTRFFIPPYQSQNQRSRPPAGYLKKNILRKRANLGKPLVNTGYSFTFPYLYAIICARSLDEIRPHKKCRRDAE